VTFGLTLAEAGVLSFRRVDAVAAMPVSFRKPEESLEEE
jgi:hypothetical protein